MKEKVKNIIYYVLAFFVSIAIILPVFLIIKYFPDNALKYVLPIIFIYLFVGFYLLYFRRG